MEPLISVIIPCYNGSLFIEETLNSILGQSEKRMEVIVIDDGSTDNSAKLIRNYSDSRLQYHYQNNGGVSMARNLGFSKAKGIYVVFFDADDIMTENFLASRVRYLESNEAVDFISGEVQIFDDKGNINKFCRGASADLVEEVLLYKKEVHTCPSNYFFRKEFLTSHELLFNIKLSSSADRFFLLECAKYGRAEFVKELAVLKYRMTSISMSGKLTQNLILDNEVYYGELLRSKLIPKNIRNKTLFLGSFILFASFWKMNMKRKAFKYGMICFFKDPLSFIKRSINKNQKSD